MHRPDIAADLLTELRQICWRLSVAAAVMENDPGLLNVIRGDVLRMNSIFAILECRKPGEPPAKRKTTRKK